MNQEGPLMAIVEKRPMFLGLQRVTGERSNHCSKDEPEGPSGNPVHGSSPSFVQRRIYARFGLQSRRTGDAIGKKMFGRGRKKGDFDVIHIKEGEVMKNKNEIRDRLLDLAVSVLELGDSVPKTAEGRKVIASLIRSGSAAAIAYCRAEIALVQQEPEDGLWRALDLLDDAESIVENLVQQTMMGSAPAGFIEEKSKELQDLLGTKVRFAMWELCGCRGQESGNGQRNRER